MSQWGHAPNFDYTTDKSQSMLKTSDNNVLSNVRPSVTDWDWEQRSRVNDKRQTEERFAASRMPLSSEHVFQVAAQIPILHQQRCHYTASQTSQPFTSTFI